MEDKINLAKLSPSPFLSTESSSDASGGCVRDSNLFKIKLSAPKFSGKSRDFAVFKRDFKSIVMVDKRSAVEIGALLKESVPPHYKYLLDKFELSEHEEMMNCLTEKFGRARIIVDECTSELKRMKKLTCDSEFIKFVNHLEKLKCDLTQLGLLAEVANTTVLTEIESKLPNLVQRDWIKLVSSEDMSKKPSSEIFEKLFEFLEDTKRQAEYFGTEVRYSGDTQVQGSKNPSFVNCGKPDSLVLDNARNNVMQSQRREPLQCLACNDSSIDLEAALHSTFNCEVWRNLTYQQKITKMKCIYHPAKGLQCDHTTDECKVGRANCNICKDSNINGHHTWLCNQVKPKTRS